MEKWNVHDVHGFYMIFKMKNWDVMELESPRCESWCWNIELQNWAMVGVNVGKYSSAMEHLGMEWKHWILQILPWRIEMSWSEESRPWVQEPPVRIEGFIGLWHLDHEGFGVEALNYHGGYTLFFWLGKPWSYSLDVKQASNDARPPSIPSLVILHTNVIKLTLVN